MKGRTIAAAFGSAPTFALLYGLGLYLAAAGCAFGPEEPAGASGGDPDDAGLADVTATSDGPRSMPDAVGTDGPDVDPRDATVDTGTDSGANLGPPDTGLTEPDAGPFFVDAGTTCPQDWTYPPTSFDPCAVGLPPIEEAIDLTAGDWEFDTDFAKLRDDEGDVVYEFVPTVIIQAGGVPMLVTAVEGFTVAADAELVVTGDDPWLLVVYGEARIQGDIRAENQTDDGCNPSREGFSAPIGHGGGGGGGGGHSTKGGAGAEGNINEGAGGMGGIAVAAQTSAVRPGCSGGRGGDVRSGAQGGAGGQGGGAIQISVRDRLSIEGTLWAVGTKGQGGDRLRGDDIDDEDRGGAGGGGGGAGGDILLEASDLYITGRLCAGGGSGGNGGNRLQRGTNGTEGSCITARTLGTAGGGIGGNGSIADDGEPGGQASVPTRGGGGGGGGGTGRIRVRGQRLLLTPGLLVPAP